MILLHVLEPSQFGLELLLAVWALHGHLFFLSPIFFLVAAWAFLDRDLKFMRGCAFANFFCCLVNSFR